MTTDKKQYCLFMKDGKVEIGIIEKTYKKPPKNLKLKDNQFIQQDQNGETMIVTPIKDCDECTLRIAKICKRKNKKCPYTGEEKQ